MDLNNAQVALLVAGYTLNPNTGSYPNTPNAGSVITRAEQLKKWLDDNS